MNELQDWLRSSQSGPPTLESLALTMLLALVLGQLIAWCYVWTHSGVAYSRNFAQSLILLCLILAMVMTIVASNALVALGLLVAISMVRFRTPVRDTRDMTFVFLALGTGMAVGTGFLGLAIVCTVIICAIAAYLTFSQFGGRGARGGLLQFQGTRGVVESALVLDVIRRHCRRVRLLSMSPLLDGGEEALFDSAFEVELRNEQRSATLLQELLAVQGLRGVNLVAHSEREEL
jgi:hypothetical protein